MRRLVLVVLAAWGGDVLAVGPPAVRRDLYGDPLPPGVIARLGTVRLRPSVLSRSATLSPDGRWIAIVDSPGLDLWDVSSGLVRCRLEVPAMDERGASGRVYFSPDSRLLAATTLDRARTGKRTRVFAIPSGTLRYRLDIGDTDSEPEIVGGGKWLLAFRYPGPDAVLYDLRNGKEVRRVKEAPVAACSPDGKRLATGGWAGNVQVWQIDSGKELVSFQARPSKVTMLKFSADGRKLASVSEVDGPFSTRGELRTWDSMTGKARGRLQLSAPSILALSDDLRWVVPDDHRGTLWDISQGQSHRLNTEKVELATFSPDGRWLATRTHLDDVQVWDLQTGRPVERHRWWSWVGELSFSGNSRELLIDWPGLRLIDLRSGKDRLARPAHRAEVRTIRFLNDGHTLLSHDEAGELRLWRWGDGKPVPLFPEGELRSVPTFAVGPRQATLTTVDFGRNLQVRELPSGKLANTPPVRLPASAFDKLTVRITRSRSNDRVISPDGRLLLAIDDWGGVSLWDARTARRLARPNLPWWAVQRAYFSPDSRFVVFCQCPGFVNTVWRVADGKALHSWKRVNPTVAYSPDGRYLATRGFDRIHLYDLKAQREVGSLPADKDAFDTDLHCIGDRYLAMRESAGNKERFELWDMASRALLRSSSGLARVRIEAAGPAALLFSEQSAPRGSVIFRDAYTWRALTDVTDGDLTPDARWLVTNDSAVDEGLSVRERITGGLIARQVNVGHRGPITAVAFSPDGHHLATGGADTTILVRDFRRLCGLDRKGPLKLDKAALDRRWQALAGNDAKAAWQAVADLAACPEAAAFLKDRAQPVTPGEVTVIRDHVKALDDEDFATRRKARKALDALGAEWLPIFYDGLAAKSSVEATSALRALLRSPKRQDYSPEMLRRVRAIAALEWQATAEAKKVLERLARGAEGLELTLQAKAALARLKR
jgi:WD40 repeat protein